MRTMPRGMSWNPAQRSTKTENGVLTHARWHNEALKGKSILFQRGITQ